MPNYDIEIINKDNSYNIFIFIDNLVIFSITIFQKNENIRNGENFLNKDEPFNFYEFNNLSSMCFKNNTLIFRNVFKHENLFDGIDSFLYFELNDKQLDIFKNKFRMLFFSKKNDA